MLFRSSERIFEPGAATGPIISTLDLANQVRMDDASQEQYLLEGYIAAATLHVEMATQRLLGSRTCVLRLPSLTADLTAIELPGGNVSAVASVVVDGVTVSAANYVARGDSPARLVPTVAWPAATGDGLPVVITYTAGYPGAAGSYGSGVPQPLKMAVLLIAAELHERRANAQEGNIGVVPISAEYLMQSYRIRAIG